MASGATRCSSLFMAARGESPRVNRAESAGWSSAFVAVLGARAWRDGASRTARAILACQRQGDEGHGGNDRLFSARKLPAGVESSVTRTTGRCIGRVRSRVRTAATGGARMVRMGGIGGSGTTPPPPSATATPPPATAGAIAREVERSFDTVLQELAAIQSDAPRNVAIIGTRHCSYLHQQIVELLTFANVLIGNHVITSGGGGSNMAVIRGALRAEKPELLTVVLPQSMERQPLEVQEQLSKVTQIIEMKQNDELPLDVASRLCNSDIISRADRFITFAFHDSDVVLEAAREAKALNKVVTLLYLD
ncbi:hypothetical protein CDCA_CDCA06G1915 [Cyanidium caldarium]|uniref:Uncharacterized protein n=1 Tax=Cyanidium caldarium TaxID=2771 RepID=A0AAV9IUX0_CYACA|nr:hypothetical protein CDCA_CDCA06G1915 [Cyanidium caldarium]